MSNLQIIIHKLIFKQLSILYLQIHILVGDVIQLPMSIEMVREFENWEGQSIYIVLLLEVHFIFFFKFKDNFVKVPNFESARAILTTL